MSALINKGISKRLFSLLIILFFLILPGCAQKDSSKKVSINKRTPKAPAEREDRKKEDLQFGFDLRLGPKEDVRIYTSFLRYLENSTGRRFRIKFTGHYEDSVENLGNRLIHFATVDSLSYVMGREKYGYGIQYLVSGVNSEGDPKHQAIIFTRPDSEIHGLKDVMGRSFAFGSKMSSHGHLIPRKMLEDAGISLKDLSRHVYTGSDMSTIRAVLNGDYEAGGTHNILAKKLSLEGKIKIIKMSKPFPSSLIVYNSSVENKTVEAVRSALLEFEPMGKHKAILVDWDRTEMPLGFTEVNKYEFYKIAVLARKYGLLNK
jgi:phosphonate transport system substrate-binding protein